MCTTATAKRRRRQANQNKRYKPQFQPQNLKAPISHKGKKAA